MAKILIIDDETTLRETVSELLSFKGYDIYQAENGQQGIKKVKEVEPHLILCDIMMPVLDGYGFIAEHMKSNYSNIPVVFLSAKVVEADQSKGILLGAKAYIKKPFDFKSLLSIVEKYLEGVN